MKKKMMNSRTFIKGNLRCVKYQRKDFANTELGISKTNPIIQTIP